MCKLHRQNMLTISVLLLVAITSNHPVSGYADIHYDPEQQDGIPVISSRSLAPAIGERYGDRLAAGSDFEQGDSQPSQRRNSDADLEEGLEDEDEADDRDEYKSGSAHHDTYENPSFGESRRAARDGDDIESFFDKHLGPQDAIENREDNEIPINETPLGASAAGAREPDDSDDDQYAAAASGPIATIISSIINRRPIVITATTGEPAAADGPSDSKASASMDEKQTQSLESAAAGLGDTSVPPLVLYAPMASSSSNAHDEQEEPEQEYARPLRQTIYVSRQPNQQQQQSYSGIHNVPLMHQSTNHLRGHFGAKQQHYPRQYPMAASQAYQRNRPTESGPAEDDDQTVSYNLSFGGSSALAPDEPASDEHADEADQLDGAANYDRRPLAGYSSMRSYSPMMMMVTPAEQQRHLRLQQQQLQRQQAILLHHNRMLQQQQRLDPLQTARGGARYHKDPSESVGHQYVQYRQSSSSLTPQQQQQQQQQQRQQPPRATAKVGPKNELRDQLLASLSDQIKANPAYWQQQQTRQSDSAASGRELSSPLVGSSSEVDTYSSYHSEIGPHTSRTTSSRLVPAEALLLRDSVVGDLLRKKASPGPAGATNSRVRRDDSEEREADADDDSDGVWVDDDEDDDNRQQSSDLNESAQDPNSYGNNNVASAAAADSDGDEDGDGDDSQQEDSNEHGALALSAPTNLRGAHGYELSPDDLMVYPPSVV